MIARSAYSLFSHQLLIALLTRVFSCLSLFSFKPSGVLCIFVLAFRKVIFL